MNYTFPLNLSKIYYLYISKLKMSFLNSNYYVASIVQNSVHFTWNSWIISVQTTVRSKTHPQKYSVQISTISAIIQDFRISSNSSFFFQKETKKLTLVCHLGEEDKKEGLPDDDEQEANYLSFSSSSSF